jgi:hypothetical protein
MYCQIGHSTRERISVLCQPMRPSYPQPGIKPAQTRLTVGFINIVRADVKHATSECRLPVTLLRSRYI